MAGKLVIDTIQDGAGNSASATDAIKGSARAWVNFNGTTAAIRASYNVSSVTRNTIGDYTINFTTAFIDANYVGTIAASYTTNGTNITFPTQGTQAPTTTTYRVINIPGGAGTGGNTDPSYFWASFFR